MAMPAASSASSVTSESRATAALNVSWPSMWREACSYVEWMCRAPAASARSSVGPSRVRESTTRAPDPSPNSAAVRRSSGFTRRLNMSAPMTSTRSARAAYAISRAVRNPVHPAFTSNAPARVAPSSPATTGAVAGTGASAVHVATITRSIDSGEAPARSSESRPAAAARSARRSSGAARRRSRTPVRDSIHSSVTPSRAAMSAVGTTRGGNAPATKVSGMGAQRLSNQPREHVTGPYLDEALRTGIRERLEDRGPPHRGREGFDQPRTDVLERRARRAGEHRHARRQDLDRGKRRGERLARRHHQRRVEGAAYGQHHGTQGAAGGDPARLLDRARGPREHDLGRRVVVGGVGAGLEGDLGGHLPGVGSAKSEHGARAARGVVHQLAAQGDQPERVRVAQRACGDEGRELTEGVSRHEADLRQVDLGQQRDRGAEDRWLGEAGRLLDPCEWVLAHLLDRQLEQVGPG